MIKKFLIFSIITFSFSFFCAQKANAATTLQKIQVNNLGLVGYWTFDGADITDAVYDRSGQGNNGGIIGVATSTAKTVGKIGQALSFASTGDYVGVGDPASGVLDFGTATNFTISFWIKNANNTDDAGILWKSRENVAVAGYFVSLITGTNIRGGFRDAAGGRCYIDTTGGPLSVNKWQHVTVSFYRNANCTSTEALVYVDGVLQNTTATSASINANADVSTSDPVTIGIGSTDPNGITGSLDDVRIYNRALSAAEAKSLYQVGAAAFNSSTNNKLTKGLVGLWPFDGADISGTTAYDRNPSATSNSYTSLATDNFNRANSGTLGGNWTNIITTSGTLSISGNKVIDTSDNEDEDSFYSAVAFPNDQYSQAQITTAGVGGGGQGICVSVRMTTTGGRQGYRACADHAGANNIELQKFVSGSYAAIWDRTQAFSDGDTLRLEAQGTTFRAYINGVQIGADATDASIGSGTPGIGYSFTATGSTVDNWEGGSITTGNNGTLTGGVTSVIGKIGQALSFDAALSQYVSIDGPQDTFGGVSKGTISFWGYKSNTSNIVVAGFGDTANSRFNIEWYSDGNVYMQAENGAASFPSFSLSSVGWHHLVLVYDGSQTGINRITGYLDGVAQSFLAGGADPSATLASAVDLGSFDIGRMASLGHYTTGKIDDVRLYNRALSLAEVKQLYNMGATPLQANSSQNAKSTNGLVGLWSFDGADITDAVYDRSGNGNNGGFFGSATSSAKTIGKIGQALTFNGTTNQVQLGHPTSLNNLSSKTIAGWIYPRTLGESNFGTLYEVGDNSGNISYIQLCSSDGAECPGTANTFIFYNSDTPGGDNEWYAPANTIKLNEWQHIAVTYPCDGTNAKMYYNGQLVTATQIKTGASGCFADASDGKYIGSVSSTQDGTFDGKIDDVRVYSRVLTAAEIKQLYLMGK